MTLLEETQRDRQKESILNLEAGRCYSVCNRVGIIQSEGETHQCARKISVMGCNQNFKKEKNEHRKY